jgi:hypothetical protein
MRNIVVPIDFSDASYKAAKSNYLLFKKIALKNKAFTQIIECEKKG